MDGIILGFLQSIINNAIEYLSDLILTKHLVQICLHMEDYIGSNLSGTMLTPATANSVTGVVTKFGMALITLKFLKKGFDHYVTYSGEPDHDPIDLVFAYAKAMAVALCFSSIYGWIADITEEVISQLMSAANFGSDNISAMLASSVITPVGIVQAIFAIVYLISFVQLYFQFLGRGIEIFIVRIGVPLACVGIIDSNGGIWTGYIAKLFQAMATVVVQIFLFKFSMRLFMNSHIFWAIAAVRTAIKTPRLLAELIVPAAQGGGGLNTVYYGISMGRQALSILKK